MSDSIIEKKHDRILSSIEAHKLGRKDALTDISLTGQYKRTSQTFDKVYEDKVPIYFADTAYLALGSDLYRSLSTRLSQVEFNIIIGRMHAVVDFAVNAALMAERGEIKPTLSQLYRGHTEHTFPIPVAPVLEKLGFKPEEIPFQVDQSGANDG